MTIANWILLGALIIIIGLLIVSYIIKHAMLQKICECLIIPFFGALNILLLRDFLPDSLHLIKVTIFALSIATLSTVFLAFEKIKLLRIFGRIFILANVFCWCTLYRTVFFIQSSIMAYNSDVCYLSDGNCHCNNTFRKAGCSFLYSFCIRLCIVIIPAFLQSDFPVL